MLLKRLLEQINRPHYTISGRPNGHESYIGTLAGAQIPSQNIHAMSILNMALLFITLTVAQTEDHGE